MARSKATLLRRSGVAVHQIAELIGWKPTVIFQVGVGVYSKETEVFREAWPDAKLIGWEPHPEIVEKIRKSYPGTLWEFALGNNSRDDHLYYNDRHLDGASFWSGVENGKSVKITVRSLDDIALPHMQKFQECEWKHSLLWLDCEGAELEVLKGGEEFVENVDVINVEVTGKPSRVGWPSPVEVNRWLLDHGFLLQYIHTHRCTSGQNDMVYVKPELFRPEYCSCPLQIEQWEKSNKRFAVGGIAVEQVDDWKGGRDEQA